MRKISVCFYALVTGVVDYLILLALAFIPFWRMGYSGIWNIYDQCFSLYPVERFVNGIYLWNRFFGTGYPDIVSIQLLWPSRLLPAGLAFVGLPPNIVQRIQLIFSFALTGWGMYYLVSAIFPHPDKKSKRKACLVASLFYMMNPFVVYWMYLGVYPYFSLIALPFTFAFVFKGLKASKQSEKWIKYAVLTAFSSTVLLTFHPEVTVLIIAFFFLYAIYYLAADLYLYQLRTLTAHVKFLFVAASMSFFVNLWWLLPSIQSYGSTISSMISHSSIKRVELFGDYPMLMIQTFRLQLFRLREGPPISAPLAWLGLNEWIWSVPIVTAGLVISCLAMLAILFRAKNREVAFLTLAVIISLGFSNGLNPPFGLIYRWLWDQFSFFRVFIDPLKFLHIVVFGYSVLLGISVAEIHRRIRNWKTGKSATNYIVKLFVKAFSFMMLGLILGLILLNSYPLLSGNLYGVLDSVHIPSYYIEAGDWLKKQDGDFRIMVMPQIETGGVLYSWAPHSSGKFYYMVPVSISTDVFQVPVLEWVKRETPVFRSGESVAYAQYAYDLILKNETKHAGKMLNLLNVKYLIVADDILDPYTAEQVDTTRIKSILQSQDDLELVKTFGKIDIYENKAFNNMFIYGTTYYLASPSNDEELHLLRLLSNFETYHPSKAALFSLQQLPNQSSILDQAVNLSVFTTHWTTITGCDDTEDWESENDFKLFSSYGLDLVDKKGGNASIKAVSNAEGGDWLGSWYNPPGVWNWSDVDLIRFWFKSTSINMVAYRFVMKDIYGKHIVWDFNYNKTNTWQLIELSLACMHACTSLDKPTEITDPPPDLTVIDRIQVAVWEPPEKINPTYWFDEIEHGRQVIKLELNEMMLQEWANDKVGVKLSYERINPTKYEVHITAERPFVLVFGESYNADWEAKITGDEKTKLEHFIVNIFANGWYINKTGEFTVVLEYAPQKYLNLGFASSMASATILMALLIIPEELRSRFARKVLSHIPWVSPITKQKEARA